MAVHRSMGSTMNVCQLFVVLLAGLLTAAASAAEPLSAGVTVVDITPPLGYRMAGYYSERRNTGTHDPLLAKAIVLGQGGVKAALVECDIVSMPVEVSTQARAMAEKVTGIPAQHIAVAATHSHTGPLFYGPLAKLWSEQAAAKKENDGATSFDYPAFLVKQVAAAIEQAAKSVRPVKLSAGAAEETRLAFNRRFHMKDGTVRFNPGRDNPDVVRPAGPIDPAVNILLFADQATGQSLASVANFALHLDTLGGTEYSADYPVYVQQQLQAAMGHPFVSIFTTGTCGDINHIDIHNNNPLKGISETERIGTTLGETIFAAIPRLVEQQQPSLAVRQKIIDVPAQHFSDSEIAKAKERMGKIGGRDLTFLEQVETNKMVDVSQRYATGKVPIEVVAIRLSQDAAIVTLPGEVFVELGLAIKQASPFKTTLVVELANDCPAYVPTQKAFAEGSYEIVNSRVAAGGGEKMADVAIGLLKELAL
jgi:neutral ceramidase